MRAADAEGPISFSRAGEKWKVDCVSTTFLRSVLRARVKSGEEPPLENVGRMRGDRLNDCAAEARTDLGTTQDVIPGERSRASTAPSSACAGR